jgi:MFS transporter, OFA family, oxalate/formate antiporter
MAPAVPMHAGERRSWFPGYTVAAVATVAFIATAPGQTFIVSQINTPLSKELGLEPLALNTTYTLATVAAAFPLVLVGKLTDRIGPRRSLALVAVAFGLGCLVMAGASGLASLCLGFFAVRFLGQGALGLVSQHTVAMWFHARLGAVLGVKQVVVFAVWIGAPPAAVMLVGELGWRTTYVVFGALVVVMVVPLALLFVRDRPEDLGLSMDGTSSVASHSHGIDTPDSGCTTDFDLPEAVRTRAYWILAAVFFLSPLIGTALLFDMQPIVAARGLGVSSAAIAVSAWTTTMAVAALPSGFIADRARPSIAVAVGMGSIALAAIAVRVTDTLGGIVLAAVCFGVGQSVGNASASTTVARVFGRTHHGAIRGSISRLGVIGTGLGPLCTGLSVHLTGSHDAAMIAFAIACGPVVLAAATLGPPTARRFKAR